MRSHEPLRPSSRDALPRIDQDADDPRTHGRCELRAVCEVVMPDATVQTCELRDVSQEGLSFLAFRPVSHGIRLRVQFDLGADDGLRSRVTAVARVCYSSFQGTAGFRIGARLLEMDEKSKNAFQSYLQSQDGG